MVVVQPVQEVEWPSTWTEAEAFARRLTDGLGYPIDEGIREVVVALNLLGFRTSQSCEGHLDGGHPYPWVDFQIEACPLWYEPAQKEACREGLSLAEEEAATAYLMALVSAYHHQDHLYTRLSALLDTFYQARRLSPNDWYIMLHCIHPGFYRLYATYEPMTEEGENEWPEMASAENLACAQAEMQVLGRWLREQWQTENQGPFYANKLSSTF